MRRVTWAGPEPGLGRAWSEGGLYEPVLWAGAGRRVMSGGEWGPCAPGDWAMPEGVQQFQGLWPNLWVGQS